MNLIHELDSWQAKLESEQFSKFLGFKKPQVLCDRLLEQARGGPGSYDLADYDKPKSASVFDNVGFGRANRFNNNLKNQTLPPGVSRCFYKISKPCFNPS